MQHYSTEDLLLYLYKETDKEQTEAIKEALETNWDLKEKMDGLKHSLGMLDNMLQSPRQKAVDAILKYASSKAPIEHP